MRTISSKVILFWNETDIYLAVNRILLRSKKIQFVGVKMPVPLAPLDNTILLTLYHRNSEALL